MCLQLPIRRDYLFNSFELFFFSVPLGTYAIFGQSLNGKRNTAIYSLLIIHMGLSSNLKKFKSTITGKYANFLFQLASGYGAAYCAALETSLAAYAQDFVLDVISALQGKHSNRRLCAALVCCQIKTESIAFLIICVSYISLYRSDYILTLSKVVPISISLSFSLVVRHYHIITQ